MLKRANIAAYKFASLVTILCAGGLVALVCTNVFARYVLAISILWSEELSRLLFVWVVFLGAYVALYRKAHMAVVIVIEALPPTTRRVLVLLGLVLVLAFLAVIGFAGARLAWTAYSFGRQTPILGISAAWGYLSVPVSSALMSLRLFEDIREAWIGVARPDHPQAESSAP